MQALSVSAQGQNSMAAKLVSYASPTIDKVCSDRLATGFRTDLCADRRFVAALAHRHDMQVTGCSVTIGIKHTAQCIRASHSNIITIEGNVRE